MGRRTEGPNRQVHEARQVDHRSCTAGTSLPQGVNDLICCLECSHIERRSLYSLAPDAIDFAIA